MDSELIPQQQRSDGPSIAFLKSPSGVFMVINWVLLFVSWCCVASWKGATDAYLADIIESDAGFYLFTTVMPWLIYILFFIILILQCHNNMPAINWPLLFVVNCSIWAFLLLISSSIIATKATKYSCSVWHCEKLKAAAAFGFLSMIGLILQAFFHHREFKSPASNPV